MTEVSSAGAWRLLAALVSARWMRIICSGWRPRRVDCRLTCIRMPTKTTVRELRAHAAIAWHAAGYGESERRAPERFEHFGMAVAELMMSGAVPIVFDGGGSARDCRARTQRVSLAHAGGVGRRDADADSERASASGDERSGPRTR